MNCAEPGRWKYWMKGDVGNKTLGTSPQYRLWLTAGTGGANLCQQDTRCRCQVSGTESLLLSSRWSLCAVKCHSKESDRAAPYACWSFHPNLFPLLGPESSQNIKHKNTQLVVAYSILADSYFHLFLYHSFFFSLSHLCLVIIPRIHCILRMICQEICNILSQRYYLFSFHLLFAVVGADTCGDYSDSQEAVWLICFVLSTDFSPQLWAQIKPPYCLCAWIRLRSPRKSRWVSKSIKESHSAQEIA